MTDRPSPQEVAARLSVAFATSLMYAVYAPSALEKEMTEPVAHPSQLLTLATSNVPGDYLHFAATSYRRATA